MSGILHMLSCHPGQGSQFERCAQIATNNDTVVLMAEAAVAAVNAPLLADRPGTRWRVLLDDLQQYGFTVADLAPGVEPISYAALVQLAVNHRLCQSWS